MPQSCGVLIDRLPIVFYNLTISKNCKVTFVSSHCIEFLGYDPSELQERHCATLEAIIPADDFRQISKAKKQTLGTSSLNTMTYRIVTKSGEMKYVRDQWVSYRSADGSWIIEGQLDEAAPEKLNARLFRQLKAYRDAVDVHLISSITDRTGKIIYVNDMFCKISQYSSSELLGQNHRIVCSGHHPREFFREMWKTISAGKVWHGEILNKAKDGSPYWVDTVIIPIFDDSKRIDRYLSLRLLITDRKHAEEQRSNYTALLEKIAFIVAHDIRGPLCSIMGLVHILLNHDISDPETKVALNYLNESALHLQEITKRLSQFVFENEIELRVKSYGRQIKKDLNP